MEIGISFIRVRVDLRDVDLPFVKQAWVSVDRTVQRTIRDFKLSLYAKFKLPQNRNISLYLQGCLVPDEESIFLLRDDDVIRVVYENLPSLMNSPCDFMGFASSSRSSIRHITDGSCDGPFPAAKKARVLSPVLITESFHDVSDTQNSMSDGTSLADISTEINADISQVESVRKKHKKRRKHSKEEKNNSFQNPNELENGLNNSASETQFPCEELGSHIKGTQDQQVENCVSEMCSKERKVKEEKHADKNIAECSKHAIQTSVGTFENSADYISVDVLSKKNADSNGHETNNVPREMVFEKHKVSKKEIPNEDLVELKKEMCVVSDGPENYVDIKKPVGNFSDGSSNVKLPNTNEVTNDVTDSHVLPKTECGNSSMKNTSSHTVSKSILSSSLHLKENSTFSDSCYSIPLQVKGDCTQSLGNNCPKKKKRVRRGKRKSQRVGAPSDEMINDSLSIQLPSSTHNIQESGSDFIHGVRNEHDGRKHIRFTDAPESSSTAMVLDSGCSVKSTDKPFSAVVDTTSHTPQESFRTEVSSSCGNAEKMIVDTLFHQKELQSPAAWNNCIGRTRSETNVQEIRDSLLIEKKSYQNCPPLNSCPVVGDVIAFKILELTDSYCPEVSDYKEGRVMKINSGTDVLEIDLLEEQVISVRTGKFENLYPDEAPQPQVIQKVQVQWSALIEPKLVSRG